ncbi:type II toxin-antitoxin system RelE/ParE family toxin [Neorhizobium sp. DT-125]|uniref:type II toxin-antitoxin system RelE/ParE family toxin n=1 Tax=Neorhizobium sp. DT-125 TaxID=3396163 RepID=UPI003F1C94B8
MRRLKVTFRPEAKRELQQIYDYIAEASGSHSVAERFVKRILIRCRKIGDIPYGGRSRDDLQMGLRTVPFEKSAVIAYRVGEMINITISSMAVGTTRHSIKVHRSRNEHRPDMARATLR